MKNVTVGLITVLFVTLLAVGVVVTSAAVTDEVSDGDGCETGGGSDTPTNATPKGVISYAGNLTECIADGDDTPTSRAGPPSENGRDGESSLR